MRAHQGAPADPEDRLGPTGRVDDPGDLLALGGVERRRAPQLDQRRQRVPGAHRRDERRDGVRREALEQPRELVVRVQDDVVAFGRFERREHRVAFLPGRARYPVRVPLDEGGQRLERRHHYRDNGERDGAADRGEKRLTPHRHDHAPDDPARGSCGDRAAAQRDHRHQGDGRSAWRRPEAQGQRQDVEDQAEKQGAQGLEAPIRHAGPSPNPSGVPPTCQATIQATTRSAAPWTSVTRAASISAPTTGTLLQREGGTVATVPPDRS